MKLGFGLSISSQYPRSASAGSVWHAPEWLVDENGAYGVPELGSELFVNGGFDTDTEDWTKGGTWSIADGVASVNGTSSMSQNTGIAGADHVMEFDMVSRSAGNIRISVASLQVESASTEEHFRCSAFSSGGTGVNNTFASVSCIGSVDNATLKAVVGNQQAVILGQPDQIGMRLLAHERGQMMRLRWGIDDPDDPQNFLEMQFQTNISNALQVKLWKIIDGVRTTVSSLVTVTFVENALAEIRRTAETTFQIWYNGSQVSTDQTVSDAAILAGGYCGIAMLCDGWRVTEFQSDSVVIPFDF